MNRTVCLLVAFLLNVGCVVISQAQVRDNISIPGLPGYITLTYDPHIHTVFSDGLVWPTVRVHEAWLEGLDIISITEHIEYRPFQHDVSADHNRAYEIARPLADRLGMMLIHGSEITRGMPPGHFNALFIQDANKLEQSDWRDALREAGEQGAFIFWNHPGWARQQPDSTLWWDEHTWLLENGLLHGIEIVNGSAYYPEAHQWCLDKGLTMIGASDIHNPIGMDYDLSSGQRRPMTLVFARERNPEAVREALQAKRTAVYFEDKIAGDEELLQALFIQCLTTERVEKHSDRFFITLYNPTDIPITLAKTAGNDPSFEFFRSVKIPAKGYRNITIYMPDAQTYHKIDLYLQVDNFLSTPGQGMQVKMTFSENE